jgi:hypothetical protein
MGKAERVNHPQIDGHVATLLCPSYSLLAVGLIELPGALIK